MVKAVRISQNDRAEWNDLLFNSLNCSYIASLEYAYIRTYRNKAIETYIFHDNEKSVAGAHYSVKRSFGKLISVADIRSGFIFRFKPDKELLELLIRHFEEWALSVNASFVRIYPAIPAITGGIREHIAELFDSVLRANNYAIIEPGQHSYWLDLTRTEDELLKQMKRQTRYEIVHARTSDLSVIRHDVPSEETFEAFWQLYNALGKDKGFRTLNKIQFREEGFSLMNAGFANLFVVHSKDRAINFSLASNLGRASYMYGSIDPGFKQIAGCPSPGQFAQWEMIRYMKSRNVPIYDLGFCPGPVPYRGHPQYSIWRFKYGFGGSHVQYMPAYGKPIKHLRGKIFLTLKY